MFFVSRFNEDNIRYETSADRNTIFAAASGFGGFATMLFPVIQWCIMTYQDFSEENNMQKKLYSAHKTSKKERLE
jgi:hypothetical protein